MKTPAILVFATLLSCLWCSSSLALTIAHSMAQFSGTQGQNSWYYGIFNQGNDPSKSYSTGDLPQSGSDGIYSARADGSRFSSEIRISAVPEPLLMTLLGVGIFGLGYQRHRKPDTR
ncbi:MAG: PEP-CTERM sorting domain-containing protein [Gammaproteobacteria bacterium]|nr:PEP-CTERM sorting domain-containing protein [Gammaproteobacteria bacterium]